METITYMNSTESLTKVMKIWSTTGRVPGARKVSGQKEKRMSEDETAGWHQRCNEHELGHTLGDREGKRGLASCSPRDCKESDTTGHLNIKNSCPSDVLPNQFPQ